MDNQPEQIESPEIVDVPSQPVIKEKHHKHTNRLFWPFILIAVGVILLVENMNLTSMHLNWWAAFIYLPVLGSLTAAISAFQKSGKFDAAVRSSLGGVIVIGTVATMLLLGVDWGDWWPLMVIAPGFSMLLNGLSFADTGKHPTAARWAGLGLWFGLGTMLLGLGFLAKTLPIPVLEGYLFHRWWAVPILIPGVGAFINAFVICVANQFRASWTVWSFTIVGVCFTATGLFALYNLNWNLLGPIILIASGIVVLSGIFSKK